MDTELVILLTGNFAVVADTPENEQKIRNAVCKNLEYILETDGVLVKSVIGYYRRYKLTLPKPINAEKYEKFIDKVTEQLDEGNEWKEGD